MEGLTSSLSFYLGEQKEMITTRHNLRPVFSQLINFTERVKAYSIINLCWLVASALWDPNSYFFRVLYAEVRGGEELWIFLLFPIMAIFPPILSLFSCFSVKYCLIDKKLLFSLVVTLAYYCMFSDVEIIMQFTYYWHFEERVNRCFSELKDVYT